MCEREPFDSRQGPYECDNETLRSIGSGVFFE